MKFTSLVPAVGALVAVAGDSLAQDVYGSWIHDVTVPASLYVSTTGDDVNNSGLTPSSPFRTLDRAIQEADMFLVPTVLATGNGMTINVEPGTYTPNASIDVPAFGISIEPYWTDTPSAEVVIQGAQGWDVFRFVSAYGPTTAGSLSEAQLADIPPSQLRGLHIVGGNSTGTGVLIDLRQGSPDNGLPADVAVGVRECEIEQTSRGIEIYKDPMDTTVHRNEIISNEIHPVDYAIRIEGGNAHSDLIRSNEIYDSRLGISVIGAGKDYAGTLRPRILSNTITNIGSHNYQAVGGFPISSGIEFVGGGSGQVVGNTIAYTRNSCPNLNTCGQLPGYESAAISYFNGAYDFGETLVIANNILYNPPYVRGGVTVNPFEIDLRGQQFPGTLIIESNDWDATSPLVTGGGPISTSNTPIGDPLFVNGTFGSYDVHLTAASLAVVGVGDANFTLPGSTASFALGSATFAANCALDIDTDARTSRLAGATATSLQRGADQFADDVRMEAPTAAAGVPAANLADAYGSIVPSANGNTVVRIEVTAPVGSAFVTMLCSTTPQGAEMQHAVLGSAGSFGIDFAPANATSIQTVTGTTSAVTAFLFDLGQVSQPFLEAEMYLQTWVLRPDGTESVTNRIRLDVEQL